MKWPQNPRSHVFISYARSDGDAFAREIHERLEREENLTCWRDRLDLEGGEPFWTQLETGITGARWVLMVLTPGALRSEWTAREWREARKRGIPICPVWPFDAHELEAHLMRSALPAGMQRSHIYTPFPAGKTTHARATEEWRNLVALLHRGKNVARVPFMAPPLPTHYLDRPVEIAAAAMRLLAPRRSPGTTVVALYGAAGMGKTTLAKALTRRDEVVDTFYDGVLWMTLGQHSKLVELVTDLTRTLGGTDVQFSDVNAAASQLRSLLEHRRCLLVADDVWRASDLEPLMDLGASVSVLVTTRIAEVSRMANPDDRIRIGQMTEDEATRLIVRDIPGQYGPQISSRCRELAHRMGRWPLLLRLAAGQLRAQFDHGELVDNAIAWVDARLNEGAEALDIEAANIDFEAASNRDRAVAASLGASLQLLGAHDRQAFVDLGVFPENIDIPLATAGQLWAVRDPKALALTLANLSLIDIQLGHHPVIRLHDQISRFASYRLRDAGLWSGTHGRLVGEWKDPAKPPDDYAWRWICHHMKEAGREDRLAELLFDYDSLSMRLRAESVGVHRLVTDYGLIGHLEDARDLQRMFARAAHALIDSPELLPQVILGRLTSCSPVCDLLRRAARREAPRHVLLPLTPSLATGDTTLRQIAQHDGEVSRLALVGDGRVVTSGEDGRVLCSRLDGGSPVPLGQHEGRVSHLVLTGDGRVVTGGADGRVVCSAVDGGGALVIARHAPGGKRDFLSDMLHTLGLIPERGVTHIALTADGRVATGGEDGLVLCAPLGDGPVVRLAQHKGNVRQLKVTRDGRVVSGGDDGAVICSRMDGGRPVVLARHSAEVTFVELTNDGRAVTGGADGSVFCVKLNRQELVAVAKHALPVWRLLLADSERVVSAGLEGQVLCTRLDGGEQVPIAEHDGEVRHLALTVDGRVVTGGFDGRVLCGRLIGGEPTTLAKHDGAVVRLALVGGDSHVVTAGADGRVLCTPLTGGEPVTIRRRTESVSHLSPTQDGRVLIADSGRVICAALRGGDSVQLAAHSLSVKTLALTGDGRVVTGGGDGRVLCAQVDGGEPANAQHEGPVRRLALTGDSRVVTGGQDGRVRFARLDGSKPVSLATHEGPVVELALTGDGRVVTAGGDGRVFCTPLDGGEPVLLAQHDGYVGELALTGDGRVVTAGADGYVFCSRLDGRASSLVALHQGAVWRLALTGDGRVVTGARDGRVLCAGFDGGAPALVAEHQGDVLAVALTADGRAVTHGRQGPVLCASLKGDVTVALPLHAETILGLTLTHDGRVVTGHRDGRVLCTSLDGGAPVVLAQHRGDVWQPILTTDGRVVTHDLNGRVLCTRLRGGEPTFLVQHEGCVRYVELTKDGRVVTGGEDGRVYCASLDGGAVLVAQHRDIRVLSVLDNGFLVTTGEDSRLLVTDLSALQRRGVFVGDVTFSHIDFDMATGTLVVADSGGNLHLLPLPDPAFGC